MSDTPALTPDTAKFLARLVRSQQLAVAAPDFRRVSEQIATALDELDTIIATDSP